MDGGDLCSGEGPGLCQLLVAINLLEKKTGSNIRSHKGYAEGPSQLAETIAKRLILE